MRKRSIRHWLRPDAMHPYILGLPNRTTTAAASSAASHTHSEDCSLSLYAIYRATWRIRWKISRIVRATTVTSAKARCGIGRGWRVTFWKALAQVADSIEQFIALTQWNKSEYLDDSSPFDRMDKRWSISLMVKES